MRGRRVLGVVSGIAFGLGLAILAQQFALVPLTAAVLLLAVLGGALIGLGLGWPRGTSGGQGGAH